jgi:hypothetical protein
MWNSLDVPDEMAETADPLRTKADVGVKVPIIQEAANWWAAIATDVRQVSVVIADRLPGTRNREPRASVIEGRAAISRLTSFLTRNRRRAMEAVTLSTNSN